jgi:hypothetical protein
LSNYGSFFKNWKEKPLPWKIEWKKWMEILLLPKIVFWQFFAWKEYNFPSGFLTNTILNFAQEWNFPGIQ